MNKIAILPLKEMPVSCGRCSLANKRKRLCKISKSNIYNELYNTVFDKLHPNCPLISIDIDELESAMRKMEIAFAIMKMEDDNWAWNTIKSTIDKLGGNE